MGWDRSIRVLLAVAAIGSSVLGLNIYVPTLSQFLKGSTQLGIGIGVAGAFMLLIEKAITFSWVCWFASCAAVPRPRRYSKYVHIFLGAIATLFLLGSIYSRTADLHEGIIWLACSVGFFSTVLAHVAIVEIRLLPQPKPPQN